MRDELDTYVILHFVGPFGPMRQTSDLMRLSEAAMTAADYYRLVESGSQKGDLVTLSKIEVVQLKKEIK